MQQTGAYYLQTLYSILLIVHLFIIIGQISWLLGNAEELPVADESYDVYTVAFGIRNMTHIETVINSVTQVGRIL